MNKFIILGLNMSEPTMAAKLVKSCQHYGYALDFYGQGVSFRDFRQAKLDLLIEALEKRSEQIVMVTDGHDSWMLNDTILTKYKAIGAPVIISGNRDHYPATNLYEEKDYPAAPTSFRYICSSQMMGERLALLEGLKQIRERYSGYTDQEGWNLAKVEELFDFEIDYKCRLFLNMTNVDLDELTPDFKLKETKTYPSSIHFGGPKGDSPNGLAMISTFQSWANTL